MDRLKKTVFLSIVFLTVLMAWKISREREKAKWLATHTTISTISGGLYLWPNYERRLNKEERTVGSIPHSPKWKDLAKITGGVLKISDIGIDGAPFTLPEESISSITLSNTTGDNAAPCLIVVLDDGRKEVIFPQGVDPSKKRCRETPAQRPNASPPDRL